MNRIRHLVGIPFIDGGRDPKTGLDCWGLLMLATRAYGYDVPDYTVSAFATEEIYKTVRRDVGLNWRKVNVPTEGCVVCFAIDPEMPDAIQHFGVYVGRGFFLHTLKKSASILSRLDHSYWGKKLRGVYEWNRQPLSV
jgi:cell wall-associated NlpC family hydrolase